MEIRSAVCGVVALVLPLVLQAAGELPAAPALYSGVDIGLTGIDCVFETGTSSRRGVLIDTGTTDAAYEIVLTAAHGLSAESDTIIRACVLAGYDNVQFPIRAIWRSEPRGRGYTDDWAILLLEGRIVEPVTRFRTAPLDRPELRESLSNDAAVRLPLRFAPTERPCVLTQSRLTDDEIRDGLLAHNCQAWVGHSGSPILITLADETYVLGIHLGSRWIFEENAALRLGRYVDSAITDAILAAAERGRSFETVTETFPRGWLDRLFRR